MKIIKIDNALYIEVKLIHPDISSQFDNYVITFDDFEDISDGRIIEEIKKLYKNSYYHEMEIIIKCVLENKVYSKIIYSGGMF